MRRLLFFFFFFLFFFGVMPFLRVLREHTRAYRTNGRGMALFGRLAGGRRTKSGPARHMGGRVCARGGLIDNRLLTHSVSIIDTVPTPVCKTHTYGKCGIGGGGRAGSRGALEGGEIPPPSRAPSLCPATVPLTPSTSFNGICNRQ